MKVTIFLTSFWLFLASFFSPSEDSGISGKITDDSGQPLVGAMIKASRSGAFFRGAVTDVDGHYRLNVVPGEYDLEASYTGFLSKTIKSVKVFEGRTTTQDIVMAGSAALAEVVITMENPKRSKKNATAKQAPGKPAPAAKESAPVKSDDRKVAEKALAKDEDVISKDAIGGGDIKIKGARETSTDYYIDGVRVTGAPPPVHDGSSKGRKFEDDIIIAEDEPSKVHNAATIPPTEGVRVTGAPPPVIDEGKTAKSPALEAERYEDAMFEDKKAPTSSGPVSQPAPRAGLLTAGEWNDLHNWNRHWLDLLSDGETDPYQQLYSFYPRQRYTVMLTNENDVPLADVITHLVSKDGKTLWEARTDNTGKAELWAAMFSPDKAKGEFHAECWHEGRKYEIKALKPAAEGFNALKINAECKAPQNVDIVWAVDATGSMGDEIEYLKTELLDVINKAKSRNEGLQYRMGTVFYRDNGDEYITKSSPLDADIVKTVSFIQQQYAAGGGDFPEAVHSALEEAIFNQKWSENAIARICFLVLDASPHTEPDVIASLQKSIREAAKRGIRIVPVTASGIQKDTEFLMKFFGLATNGTYVFLTDHSGIGGKHLEPTTDEYKVEPLNDLLVRLITEYTSIQTCEGKSEIRFEDDPQQQPGPIMHALYYPNPAVDQFTLELPYEVQSVTLYDSEGMAVHKLEKPQAGPNTIRINDLAAGIYTIRILNNGLMQSGKLIVIRN